MSWRLALILFAVLAAGCDDEKIPPPPPPFVPPTTPPSEAELLASRPYNVQVPDAYDGGAELPLVIALHGYGGSGADTTTYFNLARVTNAKDAFYVAPDGLKDKTGTRAWDSGKSKWPNWDQDWLSAVIHDLEAKYRIDRSRIVIFGHSQGGHMAHRMGCDGAADVTAVISVAGQVTKETNGCVPSKPVTVMQLHGTADEVIGYYGDLQNNPPKPDIPSAHDTVAVWAAANQCTGMLVETQPSPIDLSTQIAGDETKVELYEGCPAPIAVGLWTMEGVAHRIGPTPDFSSKVLGFAFARPRP
ncbi:MAG: alpha/beta fold hydrolase [Myxococcaceae bacterium]